MRQFTTVRPLSSTEAALTLLFTDLDALSNPKVCGCSPEKLDDLHHQFLAVRDDPDAGWQDLCLTVLSHPWFLGMLHICTREKLPRRALSPGFIADVKLNVIHRLVDTFARTRDLRYNPGIGSDHFSGWLRTILTSEIPKAWKVERPRLQPGTGGPTPVNEWEIPAPTRMDPSSVLDLRVFINKMKDPYRVILMLELQSFSVQEIASQLKQKVQWVYYRRRLAYERLRAARAAGMI